MKINRDFNKKKFVKVAGNDLVKVMISRGQISRGQAPNEVLVLS